METRREARGTEGLSMEAPAWPAGRLGCWRVEHRTREGAAVLDERGLCFAHHRSLDPYVAQLALAGRTTGELVLVDPATGAVVARRRVAPPRRGTGEAARAAPRWPAGAPALARRSGSFGG